MKLKDLREWLGDFNRQPTDRIWMDVAALKELQNSISDELIRMYREGRNEGELLAQRPASEIERRVRTIEELIASSTMSERVAALERMHEGQPEKTTLWEKEIEKRMYSLEAWRAWPGKP